MDIFAQFFIHPLMKENSVDREIKAVDSGKYLAFSAGQRARKFSVSDFFKVEITPSCPWSRKKSACTVV